MKTTSVTRRVPYLVLLLAVAAASVAGCSGLPFDTDLFSSGSGQDEPADAAGMEVVRVRDLPPEARTTLQLIENDGPFPYSRDGTVFHNFEGLLPQKEDGYYREYTVVTPGAPDRGARRIVAGRDGERYYTDDHYNSFRLVVE